MANDFSERQNQPQQLNYLAAQRTLYRKAKRVTAIQIWLSVPLIMAISIISIILNDKGISQAMGFQKVDISWVSAFAGVVIAILDVLFLSPLIDNLKEKAAKIQELFDTSVLSIPWNQVGVGGTPDHEDINKYSLPIRGNQEEYEKLKNWYSDKLDSLPIEAVAIICQRSNLCWDSELREYFSRLMGAVAVLLVVFLFSVGLYQGLTLKNFFLVVMAPALPIIIFSSKQWIENKKAITQLASLKNVVNDAWDNVISKRQSTTKLKTNARSIQDQIFMNRKSNPLIFDWLYEKNKSRQHESMYYSIDQMTDQYRSSRIT